MRNLPDIGKFIKSDRALWTGPMVANRIRVLIQRMKMRGYKPWKILLSQPLRELLRVHADADYKRHDQGDTFMGLLIKIDNTLQEPIILIKSERRVTPLEQAQSTDPRRNWRRKYYANS